MTDLLVKLFVKDYEQTENLQVRTATDCCPEWWESAAM